MYKSIKLKNDTFWDTVSGVHRRTNLQTVIDNILAKNTSQDTSITNINNNLSTLTERVNNKKMILIFDGDIHCNSENNPSSYTFESSSQVSGCDYLICEVVKGVKNNVEKKFTIVKFEYGVDSGVTDTLYVLEGYRVNYQIALNGYRALRFNIRQIWGWSASEIKLTRIWAVYVNS